MKLIPTFFVSLMLISPYSFSQDDHYWWLEGVVNDNSWLNGHNWKLQSEASGTSSNNLPDGLGVIDTYITTTGMVGGPATNPLVVLDSPNETPLDYGHSFELNHLYIGGWDDSKPDLIHHGSEQHLHEGILELHNSHITMGKRTGNPDVCSYLRVGYFGSKGTIRQYGGKLAGCSYFSMGVGSQASRAHWDFYGGEIETLGLSMGYSGTAVFNMSGGILKGVEGNTDKTGVASSNDPDWHKNTASHVGRGYQYEDKPYMPGVGLFNQLDGITHLPSLHVGVNPGSVGVVSINKDAELILDDELSIGIRGLGSVILSDNAKVNARRVHIGQQTGGYGELTISGGEFNVVGTTYINGVKDGLKVGFGKDKEDGRARLQIIGSDAQIEVSGVYEQRNFSRLSFLVGETKQVSTINVARYAFFGDDAELDIDIEREQEQIGTGMGDVGENPTRVSLNMGDEIVLIHAREEGESPGNGISGQSFTRLSLTKRTEENWEVREKIVSNGEQLVAYYCPNDTSYENCVN